MNYSGNSNRLLTYALSRPRRRRRQNPSLRLYRGEGYELVTAPPKRVSLPNLLLEESFFWEFDNHVPICPRCDECELSLIDQNYCFCRNCFLTLWLDGENTFFSEE